MWHGYIMQQYRANQNVSHKPTARRLRRSAADMVALIQGVQEEQVRVGMVCERLWRQHDPDTGVGVQELFRLYSGIDTDSAQYIAKSAQRVGLQMPKGKEN